MKKHTKTNKFIVFVMSLIFIFTTFFTNYSFATNEEVLSGKQTRADKSAQLVDSITINPSIVENNNYVKIKVNFSEKSSSNIEPGDTITLTMPSELDGNLSLKLYNNSKIPINANGINIGEAVLDPITNKVVITFNKNVNNMNNIKGYLEFDVMANNLVGDLTQPAENTITTDLGTGSGHSANVTITRPGAGTGGEVGFHSKVGWLDPNSPGKVLWAVRLNGDKEYLATNIWMRDEVQPGHKLIPESFQIEVQRDGDPNYYWYTLDEFNNSQYGTITLIDDRNFEVVIDQNPGCYTSFAIRYDTLITNQSQTDFENKSFVTCQVYNGPYYDNNEASANVSLGSAGGGAEGDLPPKGFFKVLKTIEGTKVPLEGVTFDLYKKVAGQSDKQIATNLTTDAKGVLVYPDPSTGIGLDDGEYYLIETRAPEYIDLNNSNNRHDFTLSADATDPTKGILIEIKNPLKKTSVSVEKKWVNTLPEEIKTQSVTAVLYRTVDKIAEEVVEEVVLNTANNWTKTWTDLPAYTENGLPITYRVDEKEIPPGYDKHVEKVGDKFVITNTKKLYSIKIIKTDATGNTPLPGTVFELSKDGVVINTLTTALDANNIAFCLFENLHPGIYKLKETKAVPGYQLLTSEVTIEIRADGTILVDGKTATSYEGTRTVSLSVKNTKLPELPVTGGTGVVGLIIIGVTLMLSSVGLFFMSRKKKSN